MIVCLSIFHILITVRILNLDDANTRYERIYDMEYVLKEGLSKISKK